MIESAISITILIFFLCAWCFNRGYKFEQRSFFKGETYYVLIEYPDLTRKWIDNQSLKYEKCYKIIKEIRAN